MMLSAEGCRSRRSRLLKQFEDEPTLILISDPLHVRYLTGYSPSPTQLNGNDDNWLVIRPGGDSILLTDNRQRPHAEAAHVDELATFLWYDLETPPGRRPRALNAALIELLARAGREAERVACEFERLPLQVAEGLKDAGLPAPTVDVAPRLETLREAKDADELEVIARCVGIVEAVHAASRELVEPGMRELDLYNALHNVAVEAAGEPLLMRCDVAASPRPGREPKLQKILQDGDLLILDIFPVYRGYRADFTNTLCVGGRPTARQRELFALCEEAMAAAEATMRPGARASEVYRDVRAVFERAGVAELFPHHAGHGIGLQHPEKPILLPGNEDLIVEGAVLAVEPGLYDPEAGGMRIEHNYLVTAGGVKRLSHHRIGLT